MNAPARLIPVGEVFAVGGIPCAKCQRCGVTRELARFWKPGARNKPAAAVQMICTHCR